MAQKYSELTVGARTDMDSVYDRHPTYPCGGNNIVASPSNSGENAPYGQSSSTALTHLVQSLFLNGAVDGPEGCGMAMLTAYYDDSGEHGQTKAVVMCGFVSTVDQWLLFERDWRFVLAMPQFDLAHMHMKEIRSGKGRFAKFKDNMLLQRDLFERLQTTLRIRTVKTFAGSILLDDYDRVNAEFLLEEAIGPPVVMAAEFAIMKTMAWWRRTHSGKPILIVVDQGMKHFGLLSDRIYKRYKFHIVPGDVKTTPPLQGADLAAWEIHRVLNDLVKGTIKSEVQIRKSFIALLDKLNIHSDSDDKLDDSKWFVLDEPELRRVSGRIQLPSRQ